jgi:hypothetical protein
MEVANKRVFFQCCAGLSFWPTSSAKCQATVIGALQGRELLDVMQRLPAPMDIAMPSHVYSVVQQYRRRVAAGVAGVACRCEKEINRAKAELIILEAVEHSLLDIKACKGAEVCQRDHISKSASCYEVQ